MKPLTSFDTWYQQSLEGLPEEREVPGLRGSGALCGAGMDTEWRIQLSVGLKNIIYSPWQCFR